ncbi:MAG: hypothetical protein R6X32_23755 [Chloroflexota bacterium]
MIATSPPPTAVATQTTEPTEAEPAFTATQTPEAEPPTNPEPAPESDATVPPTEAPIVQSLTIYQISQTDSQVRFELDEDLRTLSLADAGELPLMKRPTKFGRSIRPHRCHHLFSF